MNPVVSCIVEGEGDERSIPILIRRIAAELDPPTYPHVPNPFRLSKSKIMKPGELKRYVELAARNVKRRGGVLVLFDRDHDCPAVVGPDLLAHARAQRGNMRLATRR